MAYPEGGEYYPAEAYYGGSGKSHYLESVVPLVLILIVGFLVALNLGFLDRVPLIEGITGEKVSNVLLVGTPSSETRSVLTSEDAKASKINVAGPIDPENVFKQNLANYNIVLIQGNPFMPRHVRETLKEFVQKGGKLIIVQNAATQVKGSTEASDWSYVFGETVPVKCSLSPTDKPGACTTIISVQGQFFPLDQEHAIVKGISATETRGWQILNVTSTGRDIAFIRGTDNKFYNAITVQTNLVGGKVVYFNYDPGLLRGVLLNTVDWLK